MGQQWSQGPANERYNINWLSPKGAGQRRNRRLTKNYERKVQTTEKLIDQGTARLLVRRLAGRSASCAERSA
jgi:hypothetical protein